MRCVKSLRRVIVDECVGHESALIEHFKATLPPGVQPEFIFLAQAHRGIPDGEILRTLLGADTVILTQDCLLHNQAWNLGFKSCTLDQNGNFTAERLDNVQTAFPTLEIAHEEIKSDYVHEANPIGTALKSGMSEQAFEKYRTRRRRIRAHFGSKSSISQISLTIGASISREGLVCGYFLAVAGNSGVKGFQASEGYGLVKLNDADPGVCLIHALREIYLLQLEDVHTELYVIPSDSLALCQQLLSSSAINLPISSAAALSRLLRGIKTPTALPCVKGSFFDKMIHKLQQVGRSGSNELAPFGFAEVIQRIGAL